MEETTMLDTDALLQPINSTDDQVTALIDVVKANTAAFKEIRGDLGECNNQEKVQAIINKVEKAMEDLSIDSQKIPLWAKEPRRTQPSMGAVAYGQYPVWMPLNPDNPVPWPPGYTPPDMPTGSAAEVQEQAPRKVAAEQASAKQTHPETSAQATGGKK